MMTEMGHITSQWCKRTIDHEFNKMFELRPKQLETVDWMTKREASSPPHGGILADNVGAGKTYTVAGLIKTAPLWPVLILVPKSLVWQWVEVLNAAELGERVHVISKASRDARDQHTTGEKLVLATHGSLLNPSADLLQRDWGRIIVDEAHCAKNPKSITNRNLRALRAHAKWAITATPVQNCKEDLLAIARVIGIVSEDTDLIRDEFTHQAVFTHPGVSVIEPKLQVTTVHVPLTNAIEVEAYEDAKLLLVKAGIDIGKVTLDAEGGNNLVKAMAAEGEVHEEDEEVHDEDEEGNDEKNGTQVNGEPHLSTDPKSRMAILRCRQAATHPAIYYDSIAESSDHLRGIELAKLAQCAREAPESSSKIAYVVKDVMAHPEAASIVFCEWSSEMNIISEALRSAGARAFVFHGKLSVQDREDVLFLFRHTVEAGGKPSVLVAQIKCASAGLNLQCASRAYIMRPQWNPAVERQAVGRLHRSGQTRDVNVIRLVGKDTIDEMVLQRQRGKLTCITSTMKDDEMERVLNQNH